jgi:hypothetical protein
MRAGDLADKNFAGSAQITRAGDRLTIVAAGRAAALGGWRMN